MFVDIHVNLNCYKLLRFSTKNLKINVCFSWTRIQRLKKMRWEIGAILPSDVRQNLSQSEVCSNLVIQGDL